MKGNCYLPASLPASRQLPKKREKEERPRKGRKSKKGMEQATTTSDFPTWKIISDGGNRFHWSSSTSEFVSVSAQTSPSSLPSIDCRPAEPVLIEWALVILSIFAESSRIAGNDGSGVPMFRTGAGKPVAVKESSMRKALLVLGEGEISDRGPDGVTGESNDNGTPMFKTGSGKSVMVKQSSIRKALSVLGGSDILETGKSSSKEPQVKFQTAGGRSLSVSSDALQRARNLLGETDFGSQSPPSKGSIQDPMCLFLRDENADAALCDNNGFPHLPPQCQDAAVNPHLLNRFPPHKESLFKEKLKDVNDVVSEGIYKSSRRPPRNDFYGTNHLDEPSTKGHPSRIISCRRTSAMPLVEISNIIEETDGDVKKITNEKRKFGRKSSISPFKRPRSSSEVKYMNADTAEKYLFNIASGLGGIGAEAFREKLAEFGASLIHASKEYEREVNHGRRSAIKRILEGDASPTSMVVLCISAIRVCPDPGPDKVECRLAPYQDPNNDAAPSGTNNCCAAKIELTDGWYSMDAYLDGPLSNQLAAGKLFTGQKLRNSFVELAFGLQLIEIILLKIWGAGLHGWVAPVSPLEVPKTVSLVIHINGTYRAHWADRLGFCRGIGAPLAFRCIKSAGGLVPRTLVGVTRIYPFLYGERLAEGGFVVRSEKMEARVLQLYNQRRSSIAEGILFDNQKENVGCPSNNDSDSEEGAKIFKLLEMAAEPEVLMADMSTEQLSSFATYQAKQEAIRQSDLQKKLEKAFNDAGLSERQVTPLMRVRVVGLTAKCSQRRVQSKEGLITLWNPTENQVRLHDS
ncbi:hypothetical protein ACLOJK_031376 [Asimina triloba]